MITDRLLASYPLISDQIDTRELAILLRELERGLGRGETGAVVEFGCYTGTTSLFIRRLLDAYRAGNEFHVYDSFQGLPAKTLRDYSAVGEQFVAGELAVSKKEFLLQFKKAHLTPPIIHKTWFSQISNQEVPNLISFAFLDGDFFESIRDSLNAISSSLAPGAVIVVDDYANEALPGAARAVDEWMRGQPKGFRMRVEASLAIIVCS